ncbi:hypothetical protein A2962_04195 [Candidatus Woesebacteria bacterium RIFCSPLOWO2_01_FULL_39_61]|uniref:Uncharacterized protein n=1 Tax=Candidatus Woesebacteria bacterium RIFCSPHIGHO2_02_FULL_39_13 TaxID=1802505 RepID=A0A1F7YXV5_9BACT|nr:MAG: hypothetical protein A2692_00550 [Candidatus Woesebacteria bacterium RIFCSPHIGHO2_01_FULL_39_95]OGM32163.1 MAG: hypothetical protein A3D01_02135 [Candidatus Woesebacteria bacterium RIFCSPHIGHO2_02_FULL_39_13]OGM36612.1 MAG: hypothetical protein A3E13_02970 [Candidatus Woesebacteria bacterium RIFCSPHIGHO2_12_FULL_40_20]OGM65953.1 MAG: hypothetical protein A2962_04195 [Candidatus Woesebacteria bacterium RIFCSPLOWO2_01_FULL_39_61]OGM71405.1 MAG: hypothetical protein A3H19_04535 [Candidatus
MAERDWGKDIVNVSRTIDAATIMGTLIFGGLSPALVAFAIEASVVTLAGGEIADASLKRGKKR